MTTEQRLERLERQNRWMRRVGAVSVAVAAAVFLIGQGSDKTKELQDLVVRSLTVKDGHGKVRARLGLRRSSSASDALGDSPALVLYDSHGSERALLLLAADGSPGLDLRDSASKAEVLVAAMGGMTLLKLTDRAGKNRVWLRTMPDGSPSLRLGDGNGRDRAVLGVTDKTKSAENTLTMYDAEGTVIWQAPG